MWISSRKSVARCRVSPGHWSLLVGAKAVSQPGLPAGAMLCHSSALQVHRPRGKANDESPKPHFSTRPPGTTVPLGEGGSLPTLLRARCSSRPWRPHQRQALALSRSHLPSRGPWCSASRRCPGSLLRCLISPALYHLPAAHPAPPANTPPPRFTRAAEHPSASAGGRGHRKRPSSGTALPIPDGS